MKTRNVVVLGAALAGIGLAAAGAYKSTHPAGAGASPLPDPDGTRPAPPDWLFDLPADVVHHHLPTPDGGIIHAIEKGEGRPLVLIHGITLRADVWAPQFHQLTDRYRVIAVDLRGHGESAAGSDGFGMACLGADLSTLLTSLDLHDVVIVGHSMGGMTAMQFAGDHSDVLDERVAGLVLIATRAHQVVPPGIDRAAKAAVAGARTRLASGQDLPGSDSTNLGLVRLAFGDHPSPKAVRIVAEMGRSMVPESMMLSVAGLLEHDAREALRRTHIPSLVVVGTRDLLTPVPAGRHLADLLPNSDFVVLRRAGHQLMQERPDDLAALIDRFVADLAPASAELS